METKIRIIVADAHPAFREGLLRILQEERDFEVISTCGTREEVIRFTAENAPDVLVVGISDMNGIETIKQVRVHNPHIAVLVLCDFHYQSYLTNAIKVGVAGYISKATPINQLMSAIRLVHAGKTVFDHKNIKEIFEGLDGHDRHQYQDSLILEQREWDIIRLVARGKSNKEIATDLGISESTVNTHLNNIYRKLGVDTRTKAVLHCLDEGWLTIQDISLRKDRPSL